MTKQETRKLEVGAYVWCTVRAMRGWFRVTAIRPRDGYIKIMGFNTWNPPHNFQQFDDHGQAFGVDWPIIKE